MHASPRFKCRIPIRATMCDDLADYGTVCPLRGTAEAPRLVRFGFSVCPSRPKGFVPQNNKNQRLSSLSSPPILAAEIPASRAPSGPGAGYNGHSDGDIVDVPLAVSVGEASGHS